MYDYNISSEIRKIGTRKGVEGKSMPVQQNQTEGRESISSIPQIEPLKQFILTVMVFSALIVLSSVFLRIPISIPTTWITVVAFIYLSPIFLYSISTMVRPWIVIVICFPSLVLGEWLWCGVYGCAGELPVNVIFVLSSWGIGCFLISLFRSRNEIVAMLIGGLWGFPGLLIPALGYYGLILNWNPLYIVVYSLLSMIFNLVFIPVSLLLNRLLRRILKVQYLDELL